MKRLKFISKQSILILMTVLFYTTGCQKLDEEPISSIAPETFFETAAQCESALVACMGRLYGEWNDQSYGYGWIYFKQDDQLDGGRNNIASNHGRTLWQTHWFVVLNTNAVLKAINTPGKVEGSMAEIEKIKGEALFIRSFAYFQIVRLWGGVPIYTEFNEPAEINPLPRASVKEVYEVITDGFKRAAAVLPTKWPDEKRGLPSKGAAWGLLAKAYLTMATAPLNETANYALAKTYADSVINHCDGVHSLTYNIEDVFKRENEYSPEMMWSFAANSFDPTSSVQIWNSNDGWSDNAVELRMDSIWPTQARKAAYLTTVNAKGQTYKEWTGRQAPYCKKFLPEDYLNSEEWQKMTSYANMPIIRFADVLLIYAEAANMSSSGATAPQDACDAINQIISRANGYKINPNKSMVDNNNALTCKTTMTKEEFDARVILERNFELLCEYDRWFDLIRKRMLNDPKVNPRYLGYVFKESDYLWPIPSLDVEIYDLEQNPGYE
jgi:hypothetical protein